MEENRTDNPFDRFDGQGQYAPEQPVQSPYAPQPSYAPEGRYTPQQPVQSPYAPQGQYTPEQPVQSPYAPQGQDAPEQPVQSPYAPQPTYTRPRQSYEPQQTAPSAPDMSDYGSYRPQYREEVQQSEEQKMDTPFGAATYSPYSSYSGGGPRPVSLKDEEEPGKSRLGMILGIIGGVLVVAGLLTAWLLGWFHSRNGVYVWDDYSNADMTAKIEIDGDKATITMVSKDDTRTVDCDVEFSSDTVKFIYNGKVLSCAYDRRNGRITAKDDYYIGVDIVFDRE